jgi:hypothetical protein
MLRCGGGELIRALHVEFFSFGGTHIRSLRAVLSPLLPSGPSQER